MRFYSTSVLDFIDESAEWLVDDLYTNTELHKIELKNLLNKMAESSSPKESPYWGMQLEIEHLIHFCRQLAWLLSNNKVPAFIDRYAGDREAIIQICERNPSTETYASILK